MTSRQLQAKGLSRRETVSVNRLVRNGANENEAIQQVLAERGKKLAPKAK